ncbi:hypothetical protein ACLBOM_04315 [Escherichia coli]
MGYYGVQGVLAVFFVKQLGFSQEQALFTFGAFAALVYGLRPLAAMSATTCWGPNAPLFLERLCWRLATS